MPGFQAFSSIFASFCIGQISHKQLSGYGRNCFFNPRLMFVILLQLLDALREGLIFKGNILYRIRYFEYQCMNI